MRRVASPPRANWQSKVEAVGLTWHTPGQPYWNESAFYEFTAAETELLEAATNELEGMTLAAVQYMIDHKLYAQMEIPGRLNHPPFTGASISPTAATVHRSFWSTTRTPRPR